MRVVHVAVWPAGVAAVTWFKRCPEQPLEASTCGACGQPCSETDRGLIVMQANCIRWVKDVVAREADFLRRPYDGRDGRWSL